MGPLKNGIDLSIFTNQIVKLTHEEKIQNQNLI